MTKDAYWFRHDSNLRDDPRIIPIRCKFAGEGYSLALQIVEILRDQADYTWRMDKLDDLAFLLRAERPLVSDLVNLAIDSGFFAKRESDRFHCPMLTENMAEMHATRDARVKGGKMRQQRKLSSSSTPAEHELSMNSAQAIREEKTREDYTRIEGEEIPPPTDSEERIEYAPGISMRPSERQAIEQKESKQVLEYYLRQCSDHLLSKGEVRADGAAYVRKWIREDQQTMSGYFSGNRQAGREVMKSNRPEHKVFKASSRAKDLCNRAKAKEVK